MTFKALIDDIEGGILKIPAFQRDFDWDLERTLKLLDSIGKQYPVGVFLLWDTAEPFGTIREIGNLDLPKTPEGTPVSYVLDGQQRITSLYAAVKGAVVQGECYKVFADLDANPLRDSIFRRDCPDPGRCIALDELIGDGAHKITPLLKTAERLRRFSEIREAFREYQFPVVRVRNQTVDAVCEMFERVNRGGVELDLFDIMVAKTWTPKFNLRDKWEKLSEELGNAGFAIGGKIMLQAVAAHTEGAVSERAIMAIDREEMEGAWGPCWSMHAPRRGLPTPCTAAPGEPPP